jgi:WD40 repeat protein
LKRIHRFISRVNNFKTLRTHILLDLRSIQQQYRRIKLSWCHTSWVKCLKFDSKVLVTGSYDATIKEWSRTNNEYKLIKEYKGHGSNGVNLERSPRGSVVCLQFDAHRIVSGSNDTTLRVWNRETGHCEQIITGHDRTVRCLEFKNHTCFSGKTTCCIYWKIGAIIFVAR